MQPNIVRLFSLKDVHKNNTHVAVVASRLGHAQITTTLNFYVHPVEAHNKEAGQVLEEMLV